MQSNADNKIPLEILPDQLDDILMKTRIGDVYKIVFETVEKPLIEKALERTFGNQFKAAKILGINRNTLRMKIKKFGIEVEKWKL